MSGKTIFIIAVTVAVTIILMNNTDPVDFWIFGTVRIPKLTALAVMFAAGFLLGLLAARPRKKKFAATDSSALPSSSTNHPDSGLSDEDREYIS